MRALLAHLSKEVQVLELGVKLQSEAAGEMSKAQREYFLREQLKAIQKELGEGDDQTKEAEELAEKIEAANQHALDAARFLALQFLGRLEVWLAVIMPAGGLRLGVRVRIRIGGQAGREVFRATNFLLAVFREDAFAAEFFRRGVGRGGEARLERGLVGLGVGIEAAAGAEALRAAALGETIAHELVELVRPAMQVDVLEEARGDEGADH